jgi:hypothetical protein
MTQEALKIALDALEGADQIDCDMQAAITAIKEALAQEPVATVTSETGADITMSWWHEPALPIGTRLFTYAPQRTWAGLTEERIREIWLKGKDHGDDWQDVLALARSFEAELKGLNT